MVALLLVSLSVGLSNFAGAIAIGLSGVDARMRLRVALAFGLFEGGMPVLGLLLGRELASALGSSANLLGGGLLVATGVYSIIAARRIGTQHGAPAATEAERARRGHVRLLLASAALSIDNLIVGFALGAYHVSLLVAAVVIAAVSVGLSLVGLELGGRLGERYEKRSELLGGGVLIGVGVAIAAGLL